MIICRNNSTNKDRRASLPQTLVALAALVAPAPASSAQPASSPGEDRAPAGKSAQTVSPTSQPNSPQRPVILSMYQLMPKQLGAVKEHSDPRAPGVSARKAVSQVWFDSLEARIGALRDWEKAHDRSLGLTDENIILVNHQLQRNRTYPRALAVQRCPDDISQVKFGSKLVPGPTFLYYEGKSGKILQTEDPDKWAAAIFYREQPGSEAQRHRITNFLADTANGAFVLAALRYARGAISGENPRHPSLAQLAKRERALELLLTERERNFWQVLEPTTSQPSSVFP
ncbi:MAG: hypothetical protein DCC75_01150 [Proteobacteria bacterium]|nr:MAG: hypothetical protein DCC75_01150 [Pseudomonadota bacterium]